MSREERKMAQIIASIERMEQETRASGDDSSRAQEPQEWSRQGGRGKKGKKGKLLGIKVKAGKKLKVSAGGGDVKTPMFFERKLTPKKRWIQLWSAQLDTRKESGSSSEGAEKEAEENVEVATSCVPAMATSPVQLPPSSSGPHGALTLATVAKKEEERGVCEKPVDVPTAAPLVLVTPKPIADMVVPVPVPASVQEQVAEASHAMVTTMSKGDGMIALTSSSSSELRVKTPLNNESSHLSPPLERSSPTATASISPSGKVKDSDTPNNNTAVAAKFSPAATTEQEYTAVIDTKHFPAKEAVTPQLERASSSSSSSVSRVDDFHPSETSDRYNDRGRNSSMEHVESPMSEEAKRRAERRRKRKSNWDVGDPRKGGSPVADPIISAAAAAANQQSFAKYPPTRPSWRHSQSMMEMKPHFQSSHRSSSFYNNGPSPGGRRTFYHASSLPQDRSRSAGRSSMRYSYGNKSSSGSNYR